MFRYFVIIWALIAHVFPAFAPSSDVNRMQDFLDHIKGPLVPPFNVPSEGDYWALTELTPPVDQFFVRPDIRAYDFSDPKSEEEHRAYALAQVMARKNSLNEELTENAVHFIQRQSAFIDASVDALKDRRVYLFYKNLYTRYREVKQMVDTFVDIEVLTIQVEELKVRGHALQKMLAHSFEDSVNSEAGPDVDVDKTNLDNPMDAELKREKKEVIRNIFDAKHANQDHVQFWNDRANAKDRRIRGYMDYVESHCPSCDIAPLYYQEWLSNNLPLSSS